ncbi:hypothetical protein MJK71_24950 [Escherichia coli]|nr:hypothetical protein MJK71_24950 [Escherichia coli]
MLFLAWYKLESISFFTGLTMRWFRDAFCAEEKLIAERLGIDTYTLLEEMASRVPAWVVRRAADLLRQNAL